jgi:hypothetical protein
MSKSQTSQKKRLGETLLDANLISETQIEIALREQAQAPQKRIGAIFVSKGWIRQETVDFFADEWQQILNQPRKNSHKQLGYYLQKAALLDEQEIKLLIEEQKQGSLWIRLGALATLRGFLHQSTVDFFLEHLFPEYAADSSFIKAKNKVSVQGGS